MASNRGFALDLNRFLRVVETEGTREIRQVSLAGLKGVMLKTPVDNGTARANWNVGLNTVDRSTSEESSSSSKNNIDPSKFNEGSSVIARVEEGDSINISNSMPYINRLEFTDYSAQGSGMVRRTLEELKVFLRNRNRRV